MMKMFDFKKREENKPVCKVSAMEKSMFACIAVLIVCSMLFVGTTLSWFSDQVSSGATVIRSGEMALELVIENASASETVLESVGANVIPMTRVDKESAYWEPGAVFKSPVMHVENTGDLDLEYRLELLTAEPTEDGVADLIDVIDFRIISCDGGSILTIPDGTFTNPVIDQRTVPESATIDTPVADNDSGVRLLPASSDGMNTQSGKFVVVGKMKDDAGSEYMRLICDSPFILVVKAQQTGFVWSDLSETNNGICTQGYHDHVLANTVDLQDNDEAFWANEDDDQVCYCRVCQQEIKRLASADN